MGKEVHFPCPVPQASMQGLKFGGVGGGTGAGGKGLGQEEPVSTAVFHSPAVTGDRF